MDGSQTTDGSFKHKIFNGKPNTHSSYAYKILRSLAIAKLEFPIDKSHNLIQDDPNQTKEDHDPTVKMQPHKGDADQVDDMNKAVTGDKKHLFKVERKDELNPLIYRYTFKAVNPGIAVSKFYPGLTLAGMGYTMTSLQNYKNRYYTICNCMSSLFYPEYQAMVEGINGSGYQRRFNSISDLDNEKNDELELVIKYYHQAKTGISKQLYNFTETQKFFVYGQVGKGLEITPKSTGRHLFFAGGTGILPFMDTFAFMLRKAVNDCDSSLAMFPDEDFSVINPGFEISLHVFFTKRNEATGLEILESITKVQEKAGKDLGIKINITFTREGGSRLNKEKAMEIIKKENAESKLAKIFVCGPPPQNIMFNEMSQDIQKELSFSPLDIMVL